MEMRVTMKLLAKELKFILLELALEILNWVKLVIFA